MTFMTWFVPMQCHGYSFKSSTTSIEEDILLVLLCSVTFKRLKCANFIASKRLEARKLFCLIEVAAIDPQVALTVLCLCGSFGRLRYLARTTPTSLVSDAFKLFDDDVHHCFMDCIGFATSDEAWYQAQLGLNSGGQGLRSLSLHSSSAFIASFCSSGVYDTDDIHLIQMPWTTLILMFLQLRNFLSILWSPHLPVRSFCLQK